MKSNAIAHFEALTREKAAFDQATKQADRERSRVEARLQELRKRKEQVELESRKLSDAVGQFDNRKKDYTNEKARLQQVIQQERQALEQCVQQTEAALAQERTHKKNFCQEMTSRNDELARLLLQQEDIRLSALLYVQTIAKIQEKHNKDDGTSTTECHTTPITTVMNKEDLQEAIVKLCDATNHSKMILAKKKMFERKIRELRRLALERAAAAATTPATAGKNANHAAVQPVQSLTETSLLDLEDLWGKALPQAADNDVDMESAENNTTANDPPVHMQLFYGANDDDAASSTTA